MLRESRNERVFRHDIIGTSQKRYSCLDIESSPVTSWNWSSQFESYGDIWNIYGIEKKIPLDIQTSQVTS